MKHTAVLQELATDRQLSVVFPQTLACCPAHVYIQKSDKFSVSLPVGKATATRDQMLHKHISEHSVHVPE